MNKDLLRKHIDDFISNSRTDPIKFQKDLDERSQIVSHYRLFTEDKIFAMTEDDVYEYLSKLWAMLIWGNKHYLVDKIIEENGLDHFKKKLADLLWGDRDISERWDGFRGEIKGMGPAMISEILCKTHPDDFMLWNRRAYVALRYLGVSRLPRYDYQLNGKTYKDLCNICRAIAQELKQAGFEDDSLLSVDYFFWDELQVEANLSRIYDKQTGTEEKIEIKSTLESKFIHDDIRDKLRDIGQWLGFVSSIEQRVSEGSQVDTIWEATIGNMGRVIYVFEVQAKGSIDSLMVNLLKSLNNPAVQGVVAVSDRAQLEIIKKHALDVRDLKDKLRYWDYEEVLRVHEDLAYVNERINNLGLVPHGF